VNPRFSFINGGRVRGLHAGRAAAATLALLASVTPASWALADTPKAPAPSNAAPAELVIPKSVFIIPGTPQDGKDPFYPRSVRVYASSVIVNTNTQVAAVPTVELHLNGISGTAARPLAIINNRTFELGEEGELNSAGSRTRLRVLEIKPDFIVVQVAGERRILRLRPGI